MNFYIAFGIPIRSELPLVPLESVKQEIRDEYFLTIRKARVSKKGLDEPTFQRALTQIKERQVWFDVPDVARFLVRNGNEILVDPYPDVDEDTLSIYILGSCIGAVLHQRNFLVLHANAIQIQHGNAMLFVGQSGAGKSTIATQFMQKGYQVLSDDIVAIDTKGDVTIGLPFLKLWQQSLDELNIPSAGLSAIRKNVAKYRLPISIDKNQCRPKVKAIYNLSVQPHTKPDSLSLTDYAGLDRFTCLTDNAYRPDAVIGLGLKSQHLKQCAQLAQNAHIMGLKRPTNHFCAPAMFELVLNDLKSKQLLLGN